MAIRHAIGVRVCALAFLLFATTAHGQEQVIDDIYKFFDMFQRSLKSIGEDTEKILPPRIGTPPQIVVNAEDLITASDEREASIDVPTDVMLTIEHTFGEVYVEPHDEPTVRIISDIYVGADTIGMARQVVQEIQIKIDKPQADRVHIKTLYPDLRNYDVKTEVNCRVLVPRQASVRVTNLFGGSVVRSLGGSVEVESQFGPLELMAIGGPVKVNARGDFPLFAADLKSGGEFTMHSTQAEFQRVSDSLIVSNYLGEVIMQDCPDAELIDVSSRSGPVHYYMSPGEQPYLRATALFGQIHSDIPLERTEQRDMVDGRLTNPNASQRVFLDSVFSDVHIHSDAPVQPEPEPVANQNESLQSIPEQRQPIAPGGELIIDAIAGNIYVEGGDEDAVIITGEKLVRTNPEGDPTAALDAVRLSVAPLESGGLNVRTALAEDASDLGITSHRADLRIRCPQNTPVTVRTTSGETRILNILAPVSVEHDQGAVFVENTIGELNLRNAQGDVTVKTSAGPLVITGQAGEVYTQSVKGRQTISVVDGSTVVDSPGGEVNVRNTGGDVGLIALDGISGNYDVVAQNGGINMIRPESANADFIVTVEGGDLDSVVPLTGTLSRERLDFRGRINGGEYEVKLTARNGDVVID